MTALGLHRRVGGRRSSSVIVSVIATLATLLRPILVAVAIMIAAIGWSTRANADPTDTSYTDVLNGVGVGNNGPISNAIAQIGTSICPLLVKPGSSLTSNALQASGKGGLTSTIGGAVAGVVIQSQCPAAMTQLASGNIEPLLQLLGMANAASPALGLPGTPAATPNLLAPALRP